MTGTFFLFLIDKQISYSNDHEWSVILKKSDSLVGFVNIFCAHCYKTIVLKLSNLGLKNKNIYQKTQKEFIEYYLKHEYQSIHSGSVFIR